MDNFFQAVTNLFREYFIISDDMNMRLKHTLEKILIYSFDRFKVYSIQDTQLNDDNQRKKGEEINYGFFLYRKIKRMI